MQQSSNSTAGSSANESQPQPHRITGYYAGWTNKTKNFSPADIPADMLTHVNYAFGIIGDDNLAALREPETDIGSTLPETGRYPDALGGNFLQLKSLKERHPHLKTLISMGGWTDSGKFSDAVATEQDRRAFVASCIELFLTRWPGVFDGIDIDWEYPVCCGLPENAYRPADRENCILLFEELRRQLNQLGAETGQRYLLTAAIPAGRELPTTCFDLRRSAEILDFINIMTYDINGSGASGVTNFNAAFRQSESDPTPPEQRAFWNVEGTVGAFLEAGVPREQLGVGVPFYGRGFTGVPNVNNGLYQPFTGTIGADYRTITSEYLPTCQRHWHPQAEAPWLFDAETGRMMSYDDPESLGNKAAYVRSQSLGGVMIWELSEDDADSSLLTAITSQLGRE